MNKPQQLLSCLALSLALSVAALEAWHKGVIRIDSHAVYHCFINGAESGGYGALTQGTKVSLRLNHTTIVWLQCAGN